METQVAIERVAAKPSKAEFVTRDMISQATSPRLAMDAVGSEPSLYLGLMRVMKQVCRMYVSSMFHQRRMKISEVHTASC